MLGMHAGLIFDVCDLSFSIDTDEADHLVAVEGDPCVRRQSLGPLGPPVPQLEAAELDLVLAEVGAVALSDQRGDGRSVVQSRTAEDDVVQSGWADSNRRLPAPKAGTLTRLSYTPNSAASVVR
jgi:hypothetical protein